MARQLVSKADNGVNNMSDMPTLYTIGHSNRSFEDFLTLLHTYDIKQLIDVRAMPKSRRLPWFNQQSLEKTLSEAKIKYHRLPQLGGRRTASKTSINTGWHNASFRGYADYMQTADFLLALQELNALLNSKMKTAIMCAEALPWRCHRSLIADAEIIRGIKVFDIMSNTSLKEHTLTNFAVVNNKVEPIQIYYPNKNFDLEI